MKETGFFNCMLNDIDNIIFDLGGVVVNIDYMKTRLAFEALGLYNFNDIYSQAAQTGMFDLYEKGLIDTDTFRHRLKQLLPDMDVSDAELDAAWNAMILDLSAYRLDVLFKLKMSFRTFLLSNTNELHINHFHNQLKMEYGKENLADYFEQIYYSYKIHLRKPDWEIFKYVLNENNLNAKRTLFIDDTIRHIESARAIGIQAVHIGSDIALDDLYSALSAYSKK